ncbi:MAG: Lrp/AsnC family transcriptional regulator [Pseudomonadota bacterium]
MAKNDEINDRILHELSRDGRLSNIELADRVGLSPSACLRRVQELEKTGLIKGYRAVLDRDQLGQGFTVYVMVGLSDHSKASQERFESAMRVAPEVTECHNVSGVFEYLLRVEVSDLAAYKTFHTEKLGQVPNVNAINSYMVMGSAKNMRG